MNDIKLIGRMVRNPELINKDGGLSLCKGSIAYSKKVKNNETVSYFDFVCFDKTAELVSKYYDKGDLIVVESGELKQNRWEDKNGNKRSKIEIIINKVFFLPKNNAAERALSDLHNEFLQKEKDPFENIEFNTIEEIPF